MSLPDPSPSLPPAVLIFDREGDPDEDPISFYVKVMKESLTENDIAKLKLKSECISRGVQYLAEHLDHENALKDMVHAALSIGFRFQNDAARDQWRDAADSFEMFRYDM